MTDLPDGCLNAKSAPQPPHDFAAFWDEVVNDLTLVSADWERTSDNTFISDSHTIELIRFSSLHDIVIYAWIASPKHKETERVPGILWIPGYSFGNPPPGPESLYDGCVTMGINLHGNLPDTKYVHPRTMNREYILDGIDAPKSYIFRTLVAHCLRAIDVLSEQSDVDPLRIIAAGMSQGGGLALISSAISAKVHACFSDMPWLCDLELSLKLIDRPRYRMRPNMVCPDSRILIADYIDQYPERAETVMRSYRYIDPLNHARNIGCLVHCSAGGRDPSCRPATIYSVYNNLNSEKEFLYLPNVGHEIVKAMHEMHCRAIFA